MEKNLQLNLDLYDRAKASEITLSQLLEKMDPSQEGSKLNAFERQLKAHDIVTQSIPERGINSSRVEAFYRSSDSKVLFPEFIGLNLRESMVADSILPYLLATTTTIDSNAYRTIYCKDTTANKNAAKKARVTEASELPKSKLVTGENTAKIYKYGRAIEASYEVIRRMKIDMLAVHVRRIGQQTAIDEADDAIATIIAGDGNADTAATELKNKTLDTGATAGTLSKTAWIKFLLRFYPYQCNTVVADEDGLLQILNILYPDSTTQMMSMLLSGMSITAKVDMPQGLWQNVTLLYSPAMSDNKKNAHTTILGLDRRYAIEKLVEAGSEISEASAFITNQTKVLTISENVGFSCIMSGLGAAKTLEID
jgi:hypothetical protein